MNTQTQKALHKALKVLNCLNNDRVYETAWVKGAINACEEVLASNSEALAQPLTRDWKETIDERIAKDDKFKEALSQPAQDDEKRALEFENDHLKKELDAAMTMLNAQPEQEPVAVCKDSIVNWVNGKAIDGWLYTHPAPEQNEFARTKSWQGLSDKDLKGRVGSWVDGALWAEQALKEKNHGD